MARGHVYDNASRYSKVHNDSHLIKYIYFRICVEPIVNVEVLEQVKLVSANLSITEYGNLIFNPDHKKLTTPSKKIRTGYFITFNVLKQVIDRLQ